MSEIEIFARADQVLADVVGRIPAEALDEPLPADFPTHGDRPYTFREMLGYQAYDEAWIPDMVAGRTLDEVGQNAYGAPIDNDLRADEPSRRFEVDFLWNTAMVSGSCASHLGEASNDVR